MIELPPRRSYSHEAEDLIIQRLFQALLGKEPGFAGFYLDIGAFHPINFSNTYLLYLDGWRGITVEPNPDTAQSFRKHRPLDTNLILAVSDISGVHTYHRFDDPQVNGLYSDEQVGQVIATGYRHCGSTQVPCIGIRQLLEEHVRRPIDVLDLDIEAHESVVLNAWPWGSYRPKLICVEIHTTAIATALDAPVAKILSSQGYVFVSRVLQAAFFVDRAVIP
jgi:FkbM family methyltransferase